MICPSCGTNIPDNSAFCTNCGQKLDFRSTQPFPLNPGYPPNNPPTQEWSQLKRPVNVGFGDAIKLFFTNYANFSGRSSKSEYWFIFLFNILVGLVNIIPEVGSVLAVIYSLAVLVPGLACCVRRLHDVGKEWYYIFMAFIPLAGPIILIVKLCGDSQGDNKFGPGLESTGFQNQFNPPNMNF